uniref:Kinesin motor domain-containing protein n=1 Tax=Corethron hystrix TaxID=216773 RepID=A0A7S1BZC2_9STRA|mmetsp:Transcript_7938/g.17223  ORF Transcript_7938/g.17223 Transcript_7938/m.17223 type:complete len:293 (+) Transcript_7938:42-920(+)
MYSSFTFSVLEVHDEKIYDMLSGTNMASSTENNDGVRGVEVENPLSPEIKQTSKEKSKSSSKPAPKSSKLEIRTNYDGDTVVEGLISIPVTSAQDTKKLWNESLQLRKKRLQDEEDIDAYTASSHIIMTINVISTNVTTGVGTVGKLQFIVLAGSSAASSKCSLVKSSKDLPTPKIMGGDNSVISDTTNPASTNSRLASDTEQDWCFANKSLSVLNDVIYAKCQYSQIIPYRNSTLTHLLSDTLEGAAKVLMIACVSSDAEDIHETTNTLRFASRVRRVVLGKAIKHIVSLA